MKISRTGIIINTEKYSDCVSFYERVFDLPVMFQQDVRDFYLTCFEFGGAYLMIETGGVSNASGKPISESATKLRFNVDDINAALSDLEEHGIEAEIERNDWRYSINIYDPDGNRIGIRDESTFAEQIDGN